MIHNWTLLRVCVLRENTFDLRVSSLPFAAPGTLIFGFVSAVAWRRTFYKAPLMDQFVVFCRVRAPLAAVIISTCILRGFQLLLHIGSQFRVVGCNLQRQCRRSVATYLLTLFVKFWNTYAPEFSLRRFACPGFVLKTLITFPFVLRKSYRRGVVTQETDAFASDTNATRAGFALVAATKVVIETRTGASNGRSIACFV